MRSPFCVIPLILAICASGASVAHAQCQLTKVPSPNAAYNAFGYRVAGDGNLFAASTYLQDDQPGVTVWMLRRTGVSTVNEGQLVPNPPTQQSTGFNRVSLSVSGDRVAVGDYQYSTLANPTSSNNRGRVVIFDKVAGTWTQTAILPGTVDNGSFGKSVALVGSTLVVGASGGGPVSGTVYIYKFNGTVWTLAQTILKPDPVDVKFGESAAMKGGSLIVGAPKAFEFSPDPNYAYIFKEGSEGFVLDATLTPTGGPAFDFESSFGDAVAIDGDVAVVGDSQASGLQGAAYLFARNDGGWQQEQRWTTPGMGFFPNFGGTVSIRARSGATPGIVVIGSEGDDVFANTSGAAFLYDDTSGAFTYVTDLRRDDVHEGDRFGCSLAIAGDTVLIGARSSQPHCQTNGNCMDGSVYLFGGFTPGCTFDSMPNLCAIKTGSPDTNGNDVPDVCDQTGGTDNCCRGTTCVIVTAGDCTGQVAGSAALIVSACGAGNASASCCFADFNHDGSPTIDDLFLYLNAYFTGSPWANVGGDGVEAPTIDDLFLYINAYFTGCQ